MEKPVSKDTKSFFKSKTLWVAVISVVMGLLQWLQGQIEVGASITLMGALMVALRLITTTKLE
ncbi:hypothetical protein [uncultured Arcobacter sp.]|uniref:hypothetical protein n=1 Tax=uncultured Arcobacter sp. TaxID=165434 RepID=UPI002611804E|nr:hypothetical protein [uncultured Arcobacter sp.]